MASISEKNRIVFEEMPVPKALATMAIPTVVSQLIILIYNLVDVYFIGRTNNPYMVAGASIVLPIFNLCIGIGGLTGTGGGTLISRLIGINEKEKATKVCSFSIYFGLAIGAFFSVLMAIFHKPILYFAGASAETFLYAKQYAFCVFVVGCIPTVCGMVMSNMIRSVGHSKEAAFGVSMGGILNMGLDPLFMFVLLPEGYEILGAGIATALSNIVVCIYQINVVKKLSKESVLTLSPNVGMPAKQELSEIFFVGVPAAVASLLFDLDYMFIDRLISGYSDLALAAIGIVLKAERLPLNVGVGLGLGMMPIAAYNYAQGNYKRMKDIASASRVAGLAVAALSITLCTLFAPQILRFFIDEPETIAIGAGFLRARCVATPFMFLSFNMVHLFQSMGKGMTSSFLIVTRWAVLNIPMLFILNHFIGMQGVVWAQMVADGIMTVISFAVYLKFSKELVIKE